MEIMFVSLIIVEKIVVDSVFLREILFVKIRLRYVEIFIMELIVVFSVF